MASPESGSLTGMTDGEAQEFHGLFIKGFIGFTIIALIAHILVWIWKPWIPNENGTYSLLHDGVTTTVASVAALAHHVV